MEKKKILLIDDDSTIRSELKYLFEDNDYNVLIASNGREGLNQALVSHPDIIILDITMPIMDGITMLRSLRLDDWGRDAKVIMLTNVNSERVLKYSIELFALEYLLKEKTSLKDVLNIVKKYVV